MTVHAALGALLAQGATLIDLEHRGDGLIALIELNGARFRMQLDPDRRHLIR